MYNSSQLTRTLLNFSKRFVLAALLFAVAAPAPLGMFAARAWAAPRSSR